MAYKLTFYRNNGTFDTVPAMQLFASYSDACAQVETDMVAAMRLYVIDGMGARILDDGTMVVPTCDGSDSDLRYRLTDPDGEAVVIR